MNSQNALQIYNNKSPDLSFGCKVIDSIIGKIKVGGITVKKALTSEILFKFQL